MHSFISHIEEKLSGPLPGQEAQLRMANAMRIKEPGPDQTPSIAAVMLLLYPKNNQWHVVYIQRVSNNPQDRHGGQISFPGGRYEEQDGNLERAALREAQEEVGVIAGDVKILGPLTELFVWVSNFMVHPFVGYLDYAPTFIPQPSEVQSIIETPLEHLQNPATRQKTNLHLPNKMLLKEVPYFNLDGHVLWGATAMMTNEFLELIARK